MPPTSLHNSIRAAILEGRYLVGQHAVERLEERTILEWQVVDGIELAVLLSERPNDYPNPSIELRQTLADGTPIKAIWSYLTSIDTAKLVTVHFFDN